MQSKLNKYLFLGLSALVVLSLLVIISRPILSLQVISANFQCALTSPNFKLQWIHSVEKELWQESYKVADKQLMLTTTQFKTFGAGTPSNGIVIPSKDGWLNYQVGLFLPDINWIISRNVESTILTKQGIWRIYQKFDDYAEIHIQVIQVPRWRYFTQESCDDYFERF